MVGEFVSLESYQLNMPEDSNAVASEYMSGALEILRGWEFRMEAGGGVLEVRVPRLTTGHALRIR